MSADSSPLDEQQSNLTGLRDRFPGYFPPDGDQVKDFITYGMRAVMAHNRALTLWVTQLTIFKDRCRSSGSHERPK
jgi:hypothetical protein